MFKLGLVELLEPPDAVISRELAEVFGDIRSTTSSLLGSADALEILFGRVVELEPAARSTTRSAMFALRKVRASMATADQKLHEILDGRNRG